MMTDIPMFSCSIIPCAEEYSFREGSLRIAEDGQKYCSSCYSEFTSFKKDWNDLPPFVSDQTKEITRLREEVERLQEQLANVMGHVDTPIGRRKLGITDHPEWLVSARAALKGSE